jgi:serine/threonine protein kinase
MPLVKRNITRRRKKTGGKAIAAGGFGCVFDPVIQCNLSRPVKKITPPTGEPMVTKMLFSADAYDESKEAERIYKVVKSIPKYQKYFLFPTVECKPERFIESDLIDYTERCRKMSENFPRKQLLDGTALNGVSILNMPNGGMDLHAYIKKTADKPAICAYVIAGLANLIKKAIVPMNKLNVCHADLKGENIMININGNLRIIDWGLGGVVSVSSTGVRAPFLNNRPFQFNSPYTLPFVGGFKSYFDASSPAKQLASGAKDLSTDVNTSQIINSFLETNLSINFSASSLPGHLGYIEDNYAESLLGCCSSGNRRIRSAKNAFRDLVMNYISEAILAYTEKGKFMKDEYLKKVFLPNTDVWGALVTLYSFLNQSVTGVKPTEKEAIVNVIKKYLFSSEFAVKPLPVKDVIDQLKAISLAILKRTTISESRDALPVEWQNNLVEWLNDSSLQKSFSAKSKTAAQKKSVKKETTVKRSPAAKKAPATRRKARVSARKGPATKRKARCPNGTRRNKITGNCEPVN